MRPERGFSCWYFTGPRTPALAAPTLSRSRPENGLLSNSKLPPAGRELFNSIFSGRYAALAATPSSLGTLLSPYALSN